MTKQILMWAAGIVVVAVVGWLLYDRMQQQKEKEETDKVLTDSVVKGAIDAMDGLDM